MNTKILIASSSVCQAAYRPRQQTRHPMTGLQTPAAASSVVFGERFLAYRLAAALYF
jgi:hypothetical protein